MLVYMKQKSGIHQRTAAQTNIQRPKGRRVSHFRKFFRDMSFKLFGFNNGRHRYALSGVIASDDSNGLPNLLLGFAKSFKDTSSVKLHLIDGKKTTLTTYLSVSKEPDNNSNSHTFGDAPKGTNGLHISYLQRQVDVVSSHSIIARFIRENGINQGAHMKVKRNKILINSFNMVQGDFNISSKIIHQDAQNESQNGTNYGVFEKLIVPISSSDSGNLIGFLEIDGSNLKLTGKILRVSSFTFAADIARQLYGMISRRLDYLTQLLTKQTIETAIFKLSKKFVDSLKEGKEFNFSVIMSDIDHFKKFNDIHGHIFGDEVLRHVAQTIRSTVRARQNAVDLAGRYGGEEFIVVVADQQSNVAGLIANRFRTAVSEKNLKKRGDPDPVNSTNSINPDEPIPNKINVKISSGVMDIKTTYLLLKAWEKDKTLRPVSQFFEDNPNFLVAPLDKQLAKLMIFLSDVALYQSKNNGRNRVTTLYYSPDDGVYYNVLK